MIKGLDTNVLVRYLTQDDEGQQDAPFIIHIGRPNSLGH